MKEHRIIHWGGGKLNWGDAVAPILAKFITGNGSFIKPIHVNAKDVMEGYTVTGSILQWINNPNAVIWGVGFISKESRIRHKNLKIAAVRGPLTRNMLIEQGYSCPAIYGDPVLLLPKFYNPIIEKKYEIGIIPHYVDFDDPWVRLMAKDPRVKIIDIKNNVNDLNNHRFIKEVLSCKRIVSSSLHGLVIADAYQIPSKWIKLSNKLDGGNFKFDDYYKSIGYDEKPLNPVKINKLIASTTVKKINLDLDLLLKTCPFK